MAVGDKPFKDLQGKRKSTQEKTEDANTTSAPGIGPNTGSWSVMVKFGAEGGM